jgi:hypothetical protein
VRGYLAARIDETIGTVTLARGVFAKKRNSQIVLIELIIHGSLWGHSVRVTERHRSNENQHASGSWVRDETKCMHT